MRRWCASKVSARPYQCNKYDRCVVCECEPNGTFSFGNILQQMELIHIEYRQKRIHTAQLHAAQNGTLLYLSLYRVRVCVCIRHWICTSESFVKRNLHRCPASQCLHHVHCSAKEKERILINISFTHLDSRSILSVHLLWKRFLMRIWYEAMKTNHSPKTYHVSTWRWLPLWMNHLIN